MHDYCLLTSYHLLFGCLWVYVGIISSPIFAQNLFPIHQSHHCVMRIALARGKSDHIMVLLSAASCYLKIKSGPQKSHDQVPLYLLVSTSFFFHPLPLDFTLYQTQTYTHLALEHYPWAFARVVFGWKFSITFCGNISILFFQPQIRCHSLLKPALSPGGIEGINYCLCPPPMTHGGS